MSVLPGLRQGSLPVYNFSGTITAANVAQPILPQVQNRSYLLIENISDTDMFIGIGSPAGWAAAISNGVVTGVSGGNVGMKYSFPPQVVFMGGLPMPAPGPSAADPAAAAGGLGFPAPANMAQAVVNMTGSAPNQTISSISVQNGGSGYLAAPYVFLQNDPRDPNGVMAPSATAGVLLKANGGTFVQETTIVTTDAISIFCTVISKPFTCLVMQS